MEFSRLQQALKQKYHKDCSRLDLILKSRTRKSNKELNVETLANNMKAKAKIEKLIDEREKGLNDKTDEQIFQEVLGKDTHGYLHAYEPGKSITNYFGVKPSRLDLAQDIIEHKKRVDESLGKFKKDVEDAQKEAEKARKEAEQAKKEAEEAKQQAKMIRKELDAKIEANNQLWEKRMMSMMNQFLTSSASGDMGRNC